MPALREAIRGEEQFEGPPADPQRGTSLRVLYLLKAVYAEGIVEYAPEVGAQVEEIRCAEGRCTYILSAMTVYFFFNDVMC